MDLCVSTASSLQSAKKFDQGSKSDESQRQSPRSVSIHILDNDSLLHVFYLYGPSFLCEDSDDDGENCVFGLWGACVRRWWWYKLAHVCQRWRNIILGSASYLDLCLVCTPATPVADMLAHSPLLPLLIERMCEDDFEEGTVLALKQRDRVRRVRLCMPVEDMQKLAAAMDEEYPILEVLVIMPRLRDEAVLVFPETLQAPHLRHLMLEGFAIPIGSRLLTTAVGLVTLYLVMNHPSTYFHPNTLLQWLSFMPQLQTLTILFSFPLPYSDVERQLTHTPIMTPLTLPNLCRFTFRGVRTYLETLVHWITAPHLEKLQIQFYNRLAFSVPRLLQFMNTTENLRFETAKFRFFGRQINVELYPRAEPETHAFHKWVYRWHLDWRVSSATPIFNSLSQMFDSLSPMFSAVEYLALKHEAHSSLSQRHNEVDPIEWHGLLSSFRNVKTLQVDHGLVDVLSRSLQSEGGDPSLELFPELQKLTYSGSSDTVNAFTSFVETRQNAGRPITLVRRSPGPSPIPWRSQLPGPGSSGRSIEITSFLQEGDEEEAVLDF